MKINATKQDTVIQLAIEELKAKQAREMAKAEAEIAIVSQLPEMIALPTISNISEKGPIAAWLSFYPEYGQDATSFALSVFSELEKAGAVPMPASLCQWDNYRRNVECGLPDSIPSEGKGSFGHTKKLNDVESIAPLWVRRCQFTGVEAMAFYRIGDRVYKVSVKAPLRAHLSCRRAETRGDWHFEGPCTVQFPKEWHAIYAEDGTECVANISTHTRGFRDTEKGISGAIYWTPNTESESFPLTPAQMLAQLLK